MEIPTLTPLLLDALSLFSIDFYKWHPVTPSDPESIVDYVYRNQATTPTEFFRVPGDIPDVRIEHTRETWGGFKIHDFTFPSFIITGDDRNDVVRGRLYEHNKEAYRPVVILLHGWRMDNHLAFDKFARQFIGYGYNSLLLDLPYHMRRTPRSTFSGEYTFSSNAQRTLEAIRQSVIDVRATINWLRTRGISQIGMFGVSLGALLSGFILCVDENADFGVLVVPPADMVEMFHKSALGKIFEREGPETRTLVEKYTEFLNALSLPNQKPLCPKDHIFIAEGRFDRFVPVEIVERLWEAWDRPPIKRYPHGHLSIVAVNPALDRDLKRFLHRMRKEAGNKRA